MPNKHDRTPLSVKKQMLKTIVCTIFALLAFAGNSVLCRLALGENTIDAASFISTQIHT